MRIRVQTAAEFQETFKTWQRWFAWHPVCLDGALVWLEYVERQRYALWYESFWKYRLPGESTQQAGVKDE